MENPYISRGRVTLKQHGIILTVQLSSKITSSVSTTLNSLCPSPKYIIEVVQNKQFILCKSGHVFLLYIGKSNVLIMLCCYFISPFPKRKHFVCNQKIIIQNVNGPSAMKMVMTYLEYLTINLKNLLTQSLRNTQNALLVNWLFFS